MIRSGSMLKGRLPRALLNNGWPKKIFFYSQRYGSLTSKPAEDFTNLSEINDPKRVKFFEYTWGSWLKDNKKQRKLRKTQFSIEGLTKLIQDLNNVVADDDKIEPPKGLGNGTQFLPNNVTKKQLGEDSNLMVKSISSIHEGKYNRIYKVTLSTGKELVLRIPYKLFSESSIDSKIKSEVATMDFLDIKLGLNIPKVVAYGTSKSNTLNTPFILMEHVSGNLLMKNWEPLASDKDFDMKVKPVINVISDFQEKVVSTVFNRFGSLYFYNDVPTSEQLVVPYDNETDKNLIDRWRIGSSTEKVFAKNKARLSSKMIDQYKGPWNKENPLELVKSVAHIELENAKVRLSLADSDSSPQVEDVKLLKDQIQTFEHLLTIGPDLIDPKSKSIMNVDELFQPRLYLPDLDPLNVIVKDGEYYFIDFEFSTIKPFILGSYPSFVAYDGAKIYNLEEEIPNYSDLDNVEKQQFEFMYLKTRNERAWEVELNSRRHDLIAVASPHIKFLRSPYFQALELRNDKDYLYIEQSIIKLQSMWESYVTNGLTNTKNPEFPIKYSPAYLDEHESAFEAYQLDILSTPFAATQGWVPQDMFDGLQRQNIIVSDGEDKFKVEAEKTL